MMLKQANQASLSVFGRSPDLRRFAPQRYGDGAGSFRYSCDSGATVRYQA
jgi:hypothetical protein